MNSEQHLSRRRLSEGEQRIAAALLSEPDFRNFRPLPSVDDVRLITLILPAGMLTLTSAWLRRTSGPPSETFKELTAVGALEEAHIAGEEAWFFTGENINRELVSSPPEVFALFLGAYHTEMPSRRPFTSLVWGNA